MKSVNVLKKIVGVSPILTGCAVGALILAVLAGCSGVADGAKESADAGKGYTVSGKISLGNALPAAVADMLVSPVSDARSATSSLDVEKIAAAENRELAVSATCDDKTVEGTIVQKDGVLTYTLKLPSVGEWTATFRLQATTDSSTEDAKEWVDVLYKQTTITVSESAVTAPNVVLEPTYANNVSGKINLSFKDESERIDAVSYYADGIDITAGGENPFENEAEEFFADGVATITKTVKPNSYQMVFNFNDEAGNTLFSCRENVVVFSGFTTDTWFGEDNHLVKNGDTVEFVITNEMIAKYNAEIVPNTKMVLYSQGNGGDYDYYLADSAYETLGDSVATTESDSIFSYCFDADGNPCILVPPAEPDTPYAVRKIKTDGTAAVFTLPSDVSVSRITVDGATNTMYALDSASATLKVYKFPTLVSGNAGTLSGDDVVSYTFPELPESITGEGSIDYIAVHNGIVYVLFMPAETRYSVTHNYHGQAKIVQFAVADAAGSGNAYTLTATQCEILEPKIWSALELAQDDDVMTINDMLYQDEALYLLVNQCTPRGGETGFNRGGVVRYSLFGHALDVAGWSTETVDWSKNYTYLYISSKFWYDDETNNPVVIKVGALTAGSLMASFDDDGIIHSPKRFVAIRPKKLIIADDGIALYTDRYGITSFKNINRVVTVDLEKFAISDVADADATFEKDTEETALGLVANAYVSGTPSVYEASNTVTPIWTPGMGSVFVHSGDDDSKSLDGMLNYSLEFYITKSLTDEE